MITTIAAVIIASTITIAVSTFLVKIITTKGDEKRTTKQSHPCQRTGLGKPPTSYLSQYFSGFLVVNPSFNSSDDVSSWGILLRINQAVTSMIIVAIPIMRDKVRLLKIIPIKIKRLTANTKDPVKDKTFYFNGYYF